VQITVEPQPETRRVSNVHTNRENEGTVDGAKPVHHDKVGRNDPCPCGSGKKYKKCCLASGKYE
jgi:preprotein translocase subunit SecA